MQLDPAKRLAEIESSVAQFKRLMAKGDVKQLGDQSGYIAALWRQLADWYRSK